MLLRKTCNPGYYCKPQRLWGTTSSRKEDSGFFFFFFFFFFFKICWLVWDTSPLLPYDVLRLVNFSDGRTMKIWFPLSVLSLSFPLAQCVWERMRKKKKKTHTERKGEWEIRCVCVLEGKKDKKRRIAMRRGKQGEDGCRAFPSSLIFLHSVPQWESGFT